jgi:hypothetical protein
MTRRNNDSVSVSVSASVSASVSVSVSVGVSVSPVATESLYGVSVLGG